MLATQPEDESCSEEKLRWAFRMYDTDSSGQQAYWVALSSLDIHNKTLQKMRKILKFKHNLSSASSHKY